MPDRTTVVEPIGFPNLVWDSGTWAKSQEALFSYATGEAERAIEWYERKRSRAQRAGRGLRLGAILTASAAGLIPLLSELLERNGQSVIDPLWAPFHLAMAGILVLLDRFWGCTSAWVRYVRAGQDLALALDTFRVEWERHKLALDPNAEDLEAAQAMLACCRDFLVQVRAVVRQETEAWAAEFQHVLEQFDRTTPAAPPLTRRAPLAPEPARGAPDPAPGPGDPPDPP